MIPLFDNGHKKLSLEQSWCHAKLCPVSLLMLLLEFTFYIRLPQGSFPDPKMNSFTELCADNMALLICHCRRIPIVKNTKNVRTFKKIKHYNKAGRQLTSHENYLEQKFATLSQAQDKETTVQNSQFILIMPYPQTKYITQQDS